MEFDINWLANPEIFKVNCMEAHSYQKYYKNEKEAKNKETSFAKSLNGLWKFHYASNYSNTMMNFQDPTYDCKRWGDIKVPGHMETQGYDIPHYVGVMYPWDGHEEVIPGEVPTKENPVGSYVKYFYVPDEMKNGPLYISFQGVESGFSLWLNGSFVGYSEDSFTPSDFDLTPYVIEGENKLAVQVYKWTSGSWLEDQDFYRFSGIFRDVYLYTVPKIHISDMFVKTRLNETFDFATIEITMKSTDVKGNIEANIYNIITEPAVIGMDALNHIR